MSAQRAADGRIHDWLQEELDSVSEPQRAVQEAIHASSTAPQRQPRRGLRARLADLRAGDPAIELGTEPEVVLWATPQSQAAPTSAVLPARRPGRYLMALSAVALGGFAVLSGALLTGWLGAPPPDVSPGDGAVRYGALPLEPASGVSREIIVAADGSGHFWTISDAVSQAIDGDAIAVMPGTYEESVVVSKDISISGQGDAGAVVVRHSSAPQALPHDYTSMVDFVPDGTEPIDPQDLSDDWRYVFYLRDSDATISGLSVLGSVVGSAIVVEGGEPVLSDLVLDPEGSQLDGRPLAPHEALTAYGNSSVTLQGSTVTGVVTIHDGSPATLLDNQVEGTCIVVGGSGSDATIIGNHLESGGGSAQCPRFSIAVLRGASPVIDANTIVSDRRIDGILVLGPDAAPTIQGNNVSGVDSGIWIGGEARGLITRNNVLDSNTGIRIVGASPRVITNGFVENDVGASIDSGSMPEFEHNKVCRNTTDLVLGEGVSIAMDLNPDICTDAAVAVGN